MVLNLNSQRLAQDELGAPDMVVIDEDLIDAPECPPEEPEEVKEAEPATTPQPMPTPAPEPEVQPQPTAQELDTWMAYVERYNGVCPSQQPKDSPWWQYYRFSAAAGADTSHGYSLRQVIQTYWEGAKAGRMTGIWMLDNFANLGLSFSSLNSRGALFINLDQMQVYWDGSLSELRPWPYPDHPVEWDTMVTEAQSYLDALNSRYNSRCPNE